MNNEVSRFEKVKKHIKENKKVYIVGGAAFITGAIVGAIALTRKPVTADEYFAEIINQFRARQITVNTTNVYKTISMYGNDIGRPGNPVVDTTTWKRFESQSLAAKSVGVTNSQMSNHLAGRRTHLNGHVFKSITPYG